MELFLSSEGISSISINFIKLKVFVLHLLEKKWSVLQDLFRKTS